LTNISIFSIFKLTMNSFSLFRLHVPEAAPGSKELSQYL
jgi:hypothetical protein